MYEEKKKKRNAVAMSGIQLICVGNDDGWREKGI
jgi:hypothetical protein